MVELEEPQEPQEVSIGPFLPVEYQKVIPRVVKKHEVKLDSRSFMEFKSIINQKSRGKWFDSMTGVWLIKGTTSSPD